MKICAVHMYTAETLYKGHAGTMCRSVLYSEVNGSIIIGSKQLSFIERFPLFGVSVRGSTVYT